ncbi:unnamed protein product [Rotaria sp. Silwood2]|nr:unnamed protein product [Rotaria sp. Silwood2]
MRAPIRDIPPNAKWAQNGTTVAGGHGKGSALNQLNDPRGIFVDDDMTIFIADWGNHRIMSWKVGAMIGQVVAGGNGPGDGMHQLNHPFDVIVDKRNDSLIISDNNNRRVVRWPRQNGNHDEIMITNIQATGLTTDDNDQLYVADWGKHEVRRYQCGDTKGTIVAGGNEYGQRLDQLSGPCYIFIDREHSLYVSQLQDCRVIKWQQDATQGIIVAGGQGEGSNLTQLHSPMGVVADQLGTVYVADHYNHRIMRWPKGATQGSVVIDENGS